MNRFKQTRNLLRRLTSIPSASLGFSKMCLPRYFSISMAKVGQKRRKWQLLYTTLTTSVRQNIYTHRVWTYCRYNIAENFLRLTLYWEDLAQDLASSREVHMFSARTQEDNTDNCAQPTNPSQLCEQSRNHQTYMWAYHKKIRKKYSLLYSFERIYICIIYGASYILRKGSISSMIWRGATLRTIYFQAERSKTLTGISLLLNLFWPPCITRKLSQLSIYIHHFSHHQRSSKLRLVMQPIMRFPLPPCSIYLWYSHMRPKLDVTQHDYCN